jgi:hypothetical protein
MEKKREEKRAENYFCQFLLLLAIADDYCLLAFPYTRREVLSKDKDIGKFFLS